MARFKVGEWVRHPQDGIGRIVEPLDKDGKNPRGGPPREGLWVVSQPDGDILCWNDADLEPAPPPVGERRGRYGDALSLAICRRSKASQSMKAAPCTFRKGGGA